MQSNVLNVNYEINYKLLFQTLMLICIGFVIVVFTADIQSIFLGLSGVGALAYNNFIYNPKRSRKFCIMATSAIVLGYCLSALIHFSNLATLPIALLICFLVGFANQVKALFIFAGGIIVSLLINYAPSIHTELNLLIQVSWLFGGIFLYFVSCVLFDGYIDEHKLVANKQVNKVVVESWQNIQQFNNNYAEQSLVKINQQIDIMVAEIVRLQELRSEYDYYCKLDDNFECQIENNLHKLISFHDLISKQVYNTILNKNQQLTAEGDDSEFDELSD